MNKINPLEGYVIELSPKAKKAIRSLDFSTQKKIFEKLEALVSHAHSLDVKKLTGYESFFRIKVGDYRIIYEPLHQRIVVYVIFAGHRKNIYSEFGKFAKS